MFCVYNFETFSRNELYLQFNKIKPMHNYERLIISRIKIMGNLQLTEQSKRYLRFTCGKMNLITAKAAKIIDLHQIVFQNINWHFKKAELVQDIQIEVFEQHKFGPFDEYLLELHSKINIGEFGSLRGEFLQLDLTNINNEKVGIMIIMLEIFERDRGFQQKINQNTLTQRSKRQIKSPTKNNIKELLVQNMLSHDLMKIMYIEMENTINDTEYYGKQCFIGIRYGKLKAYTKLQKTFSPQIKWIDEMEFIIDQNQKFQFFFYFQFETGEVICKAKGQIKYIVFDETTTAHTITLYQKRRNKYGVLHVKFKQNQSNALKQAPKIDKKLKDMEKQINHSLEDFNKMYFEGKYNKHLLAENVYEKQLLEMEEQQKLRPLNPEQKLIKEQNKRFVEFLQKQLIKFDREHHQKKQKKKRYPPLNASIMFPQMQLKQRSNSKSTAEVITNFKLPKI